MNITVRVMSKQAQAMLAQLERQITTTSRVAGASTFGAASAGNATKSFKSLGNSMQWAGYQLMHAFTIPLLAAGGAAAKYELDNEKAFAGVQKVYGDSALAAQHHGKTVTNELAALRKEFVALSDVYGVSQTQVLGIAESWAAAGVSGAALGKSVENTMKTMVIGDLDAASATKALIAIQAQYGASTTQMTDILNALNVVENQTGASMGDLITGFGNAASVAAQAGVDYRHLAAMIAALVPAQGSAAKAGNALKSIFTNLLVPTKRGAEALKEMGINVDDTAWRSKTATERLELLSVKFRKLDGNQKVAASNYIAGKYQISRFAQSMADLSKSFDANGKLITGNYSALGEYGRSLDATKDKAKNASIAQGELNTVLQSNPQKLKQVWTILKNDAASAVARLIPFLIQFVTIIAGLVHSFSNLNPVIQRWVAILVITLALLGPILLYVAAISKLFAVMGTIFRTAGKGLMWFIGLFTGANKEVRTLEVRIAELRAELDKLTATTPIEKLNAEIEMLEAQIASLNAETAKAASSMAEEFSAASASIVADAEVAQAAQEESAAAAAAANAAAATATEAEWTAAYTAVAVAAQAASVAQISAAGRSAGALGGAGAAGSALALRGGGVAGRDAVSAGAGGAVGGTRLIDDGAATAKRGIDDLGKKTTKAAEGAAEKTQGIFGRMFGSIGGLFRSGVARLAGIMGPGMAAAGAEGAGGVGIFGAAVAAVAGAPVALIIAAVLAVIAVFLIFRHQLTALGKWLVGLIVDMAKGVWGGLKAIGGFFADAAQWVINSMVALPGAILQIMQSVVNIIGKAAKEVYELFSYINPFAHHSPSLVENVDKGMDRVARKFAGIRGSISNSMKLAYADIKSFGAAIAGLIKTDAQAKEAADVQLLSKYAPGAIASYKVLAGDLAVLTDQYNKLGAVMQAQQAIVDSQKAVVDNLNNSLTIEQAKLDALKNSQTKAGDALDASKQKMQDFASAPIAGMKAMRDQIFANDMAQKALQLQMDKFGDSVGGIDNVQKKMSDLAGQIEKLKGEQSGLRAGGAGSDILGAYDKQIAALEGQQSGIQATVNSYASMQTALDKLNKQSDELSLQQSLEFDPLTKQIQDLVDTTKELPFATIVAGIQSTQAEITKNTIAYDAATVAVNKQQAAVDALTVARDKQQAILDIEQKKLDGISNAYSKVGDAISAVNAEMSLMTGAANDLASAQAKVAATKTGDNLLGSQSGLKDASGTATIGRDGGLADQSSKIDADTKAQMDKLKGLFDKMDLFGGLKKKFGAVADWIKKWIWEEPAKWGDWISANTVKLAKLLWSWIGEGISSIAGWFSAGWNAITSWFSNLPSNLLALVKNLPGLLVSAGKHLIYGLGYGIGYAFGTLVKILLAIPAFIVTHFVGAVKWLWGAGGQIMVGLFKGIVWGLDMLASFFAHLPIWVGQFFANVPHWLWEAGKLLINGIYLGITRGIPALWGFFTSLPGKLIGFFAGAGKWLWNIGGNILSGLWNGVKAFFSTIWSGIKSFIGGFIDGFKKALGINSPSTVFMEFGKNIMEGLWNGIKGVFSFIISFFVGLGTKIITGVGNLVSTLYHAGIDLLTGLWNGIVYIWNSVVSFFTNFVPNILVKIGRMEHSLYQKGLDFLNGLWNGIKYVWNTVLSFFGNLAITIVTKIGNVARSIYNKGKDFLSGLFTGITDGAVAVWNFFMNLPKKIGGAFATAATWLYDAGKSIASGLYDGVKKGLEFLAKIFGTPVYWAVHYAINPIIKGINYLPGVDISTIPEKNIPHFAKGGMVPGKHNRDDVQIYATPGEVVVPKNIVNAMGGAQSLMDAMSIGRKNSARPGYFAQGGEVPAQTPGRYGPTGGYDDPRASQSERNKDRILSDLAAQGGTILGKFVDKATKLIRKGAANAFMGAIGNPIKKGDNVLDKMKGGFGLTLNKSIDNEINTVYKWILGKENSDVKKAAKLAATGGASNYEKIIIDQADSMGLGRKGAEIGLMTALVESNMKNYANSKIPESLKIPHDAVGSDHYSAGLFQQQTGPFGTYWGTVAQVMNPSYSSHRFYQEMKKKVPNWASMDSGTVAQTVQVSAFPAAYNARQGDADRILDNILGAPTSGRGGKNIAMDSGGLLPTGLTQIFNGTGKPEVVAPAKTFDDLFGGITENLKSASSAFAKLKTQANSSSAEQTVVNNHTEYNFYGDLSFPNVENSSDASDFLSNLESMVKK